MAGERHTTDAAGGLLVLDSLCTVYPVLREYHVCQNNASLYFYNLQGASKTARIKPFIFFSGKKKPKIYFSASASHQRV